MDTTKNKHSPTICAPISHGELIDKISILEIKKERLVGSKLQNINKELESLKVLVDKSHLEIDVDLFSQLKQVNTNLWEIEDQIRIKEKNKEFDNEFIQLARSVYKQNDMRASIKREINQKYNSQLIEEKSYKKYQ